MRTSVNMRDELLVRLNDIAKGVGYKSWRCMLTGIAKGEVLVRKPLNHEGRVKIERSDYYIPAHPSCFSATTPKPDWNTPVA